MDVLTAARTRLASELREANRITAFSEAISLASAKATALAKLPFRLNEAATSSAHAGLTSWDLRLRLPVGFVLGSSADCVGRLLLGVGFVFMTNPIWFVGITQSNLCLRFFPGMNGPRTYLALSSDFDQLEASFDLSMVSI
jgi:hypothetical protein